MPVEKIIATTPGGSLPSILVPIVCVIFPGLAMAYFFAYSQKKDLMMETVPSISAEEEFKLPFSKFAIDITNPKWRAKQAADKEKIYMKLKKTEEKERKKKKRPIF